MNGIRKGLLTSALLLSMLGLMEAATQTVYFGTTPGDHSGAKGIYAAVLDTEDGSWKGPASLAAEVDAAGFLAWHPRLPVLYSLNGTSMAAFTESTPGELSPLNTVPSNAGKGTHLDVDPLGRVMVTAHYGDGKVAVFPLDADGQIGPVSQVIELEAFSTAHPSRQGKPHPHSANFSPCGRFVLVPDLGADTTYVYACDPETATLSLHGQADSAPGAGPRHLKFSHDGRFVHVLNELDLTIDSFRWDSVSGRVEKAGTIPTLSDGQMAENPPNTASEIRVHPGGAFVYAGNRGHNSVSVFRVDTETCKLDRVAVEPAGVIGPRNFAIDPSGQWLITAGQWSANAVVFAIDPDSGALEPVSSSPLSVPGPICVAFGTPANRP